MRFVYIVCLFMDCHLLTNPPNFSLRIKWKVFSNRVRLAYMKWFPKPQVLFLLLLVMTVCEQSSRWGWLTWWASLWLWSHLWELSLNSVLRLSKQRKNPWTIENSLGSFNGYLVIFWHNSSLYCTVYSANLNQ